MKFVSTLIAVKNIELSKLFYQRLFNQEVQFDFGKNINFKSGLCLQEDFNKLIETSEEDIKEKTNNMELYFEVDDFETFITQLEKDSTIKYVHPPKMHEWKQRVVRIYDPDFHIIEIGESMSVIARRYLSNGYTVEDTAQIIQHPIDFVKKAMLL